MDISLRFDWTGSQFPDTGLKPEELELFSGPLNAVRREVLETDEEQYASGSIPAAKQPLDAAFVNLPDRLLSEYEAQRSRSELGQILEVAKEVRDQLDTIVVLGIGGSYMGARALLESCCHPFHNFLSRAERGGVPRMFFEGDNLDNDAVAGLLELLNSRTSTGAISDWGLVVISKSGSTLETAAAFRIFLRHLLQSLGGDLTKLAERVIPVTGAAGRLRDLVQALGCRRVFDVPEGVGGRFSIFSAVGLVPASILGLDVIQLLRGAAAMNAHFRSAAPSQNLVLQYAGICHLLEEGRNLHIRVLSVWSKALEALGLWYDQLLAESLGKQGRGATPITVVNTRDLHSRAQQHQEGRRDKLITNLVIRQTRTDPIAIGPSKFNQDLLNVVADRTYPQLMRTAVESTNRSYADDRRPTATIECDNTSEYTLGQLLQMLMLATVVEGRLLGINPYGQPGVEGYKRYMKQSLGLI